MNGILKILHIFVILLSLNYVLIADWVENIKFSIIQIFSIIDLAIIYQ